MKNDYSEIVQFRLSPEQKKMAQKDAHRHEMTLAEYLRLLLDLGHELLERQNRQRE